MKKTPKQTPNRCRLCESNLTMRESAIATLREYESAEVAERINKIEFGFFADEKGTSEQGDEE